MERWLGGDQVLLKPQGEVEISVLSPGVPGLFRRETGCLLGLTIIKALSVPYIRCKAQENRGLGMGHELVTGWVSSPLPLG